MNLFLEQENNMSKTKELMKKVSIALTGGIAISTLTSCGSQPSFEPTEEVYYESSDSIGETEQLTDSNEEEVYDEEDVYEEEVYDEEDYEEDVYEDEIYEDYTYSPEEVPYDENCVDWTFDEEENVWICNDQSSSYYGNFFFMGTYFATKNMLYSNNQFKEYKSTGIVSGTGTSSSTKKSGFGSGVSGGFGG